MRIGIIAAVISTIILLALAGFYNAFSLDIPSMIYVYPSEAILVIIACVIITSLISIEIHLFCTRKYRENIENLQKDIETKTKNLNEEIDAYKKELEDLRKADIAAQRLLAVTKAKEDGSI